jgi:tRNA dimethylallyltransferase
VNATRTDTQAIGCGILARVKPLLTVITGPTASGKTGIAVELARRAGGEIVNADSQQVYRFFDIGTAKPSPE